MSSESAQQLLTLWSTRYRQALLKFFNRRMPPGSDREDLVQEVFLKMAKRQDLQTVRDAESYLFHAAGNVLRDWRRRQITHASDRHDPLTDSLDVGLTPERVLLGKEALESMLEALAGLPERTRIIFVLYHFEQLSHAQIARELGIAVRTIEDHMSRANRSLLKGLRDLL